MFTEYVEIPERPRYTAWMRGASFFDAGRHPWMEFVSDPYAPELLRTGGSLRGELTLDGRLRPQGKALVERVIATTGQFVWVEAEEQLDAVTALSGSGPAYVFLFLEAMTQAGVDMGLPPAQAYQLAVATFQGASELAARSPESAEVLRQRVTSKGGTTHAAITHLQAAQVPAHFIAAMRAAEARAKELAAEFGA